MQAYLEEDVGWFDDSPIIGGKQSQAIIKARQPGVMCGIPFIRELFDILNCAVQFSTHEGEQFEEGPLITIYGSANDILNGERTALNILARTIGIATLTRRVCYGALKNEWRGRIAGTRKTTPGFRLCEKYALEIGGADCHRLSLRGCCMLKDNHLACMTRPVAESVSKVKESISFTRKLEVEVSNWEDAMAVASGGADIVMFDNCTAENVIEWSQHIKKSFPNILIEVSGGITENTIGAFLHPSIDVISMGELTMHYAPVDLSLSLSII